MAELSEFSKIVDGEWPETQGKKPPAQDELTRALQVLLTRQIIYSHTAGLGGAYEVLRIHASFVEGFFGALGYRLVVSARDQMVALSVPQGSTRYDSVYERLRKDETIVLLAIRLIWEEAVTNQNLVEGGIAETTTSDLVDRIKNVTQQEAPDEGRLLDILRLFARHGALRVGQRDRIERVTPLEILPGISILVPDTYVDDLRLWAVSPTTASVAAANQNNEF